MVKLEKVHYKNRHLEPVWHVQAAVLAAIVLQLLLDNNLTIGPKSIVIGLEILLFIALALIRPGAKQGLSQNIRRTSAVMLIGLVSLVNFSSLVLVINNLFGHIAEVEGTDLLLSALSIYLTNIIIFGLWYWELDSDGVQGQSTDIEPIDFLFPQMSVPNSKAAREWSPTFFDYLYLSITNGTAFSTNDVSPLTHRAKLLMTIQSVISIAVVALVITRAVSILA
jgi:uncharacterized membrane protein